MVKRRWVVLVGIPIVIVCGYLGVRTLLSSWVRGFYEEGRYAEMKAFFDRPQNFPQDFIQEPTYSKELMTTGEEIDRLYKNLQITQIDFMPLEKLQKGGKLTESEWASVGRSIQHMTPFTDKLIAFSQHPEYEMGAWSLDPVTKVPSFIAMQVSAKALLLNAYCFENRNAWNNAFSNAMAVFRLTQRNPASSMISHLIAIAMQSMAAETIFVLTDRCNDPAILRTILQELNRLDPKINLNSMDRAQLFDLIVSLRERKKENPSIDLTPGKNGYHYYRQFMDWTFQQYKKQTTQNWPKQLPSFPFMRALRAVGFGRQVDELMFSVFNAVNAAPGNREKYAVAKYRLAQILLAAKIHQIETGKPISQVSELVPAYLPKKIDDPFAQDGTNADYRFDTKRKMFYSIGPDLQDNGNQVIYDPSNGMISAGDISPLYQ